MNRIPQSYHDKPLIYAWNYCAMDSAPLGVVGRFQDGNGKKDIVPFFKRNGENWIAGIELNPRPLFGLDKLAGHAKDKAVFIVEGEKSATALQSIGITAVTSLGGSKAAKQADWIPLNGYKLVYLLPQNKSGVFEVYNITGQLIYKMNLPPWSTLQFIQLPELSNGVYTCVVKSGYEKVGRKLVMLK